MVCGGLWWFACIVSGYTTYRPKGWWSFVVVCHFAVIMCGGLGWFVVVYGGLRWFAMVCGGLSFSQPPRNQLCH